MKKILIMALVFSLALVPLTGAVQGTIDDLQGHWVESYDGNMRFRDGDDYPADIVAVAMPSENVAHNTGRGGSEAGNLGTFGWGADHATDGWDPDPAPIGDDVYFVSEGEHDGIGYFWAAMRESFSPEVANPNTALLGQYEPIAQPEEVEVGTDYIEIQIPAPRYTCYDADAGESQGLGQFDLLESYAVFVMGGDYGDWTHVGNAVDFVAGPDNPIMPFAEDTNPEEVDTGHFTFTVSDLDAGTEYEIMVRANLDFGGYSGGYDGGLGSYTTFGAGASSGPIQTEDDVPEFGPGMMVPVVAIVGMFVAFTVYRRKKEE